MMAADNSDVTLGELARRLSSMETRIDEKFVDVNRRLDNLNFVSQDVHALAMKSLSERVETLEESKRWMARTLVASFAFPVLVAILVALVVTQ